MRHCFYIFALAMVLLNAEKTQAQLDTHRIVHQLIVPHDSILAKIKRPIELVEPGQLEPFLAPSFYRKKISFDFSKRYIAGVSVCTQCEIVCQHSGTNDLREPCHRNRCRYSFAWKVRDRDSTHKIDYQGIFVDDFPYHWEHKSHPDTVIISDKNALVPLEDLKQEYIYLFRHLGGDCHARFTYDVFKDEKRRTITWVVHNIYGGCRAGLYKQVCIRIANPGPGYTFVFSEVLEDSMH